jgi:hypothetical protein
MLFIFLLLMNCELAAVAQVTKFGEDPQIRWQSEAFNLGGRGETFRRTVLNKTTSKIYVYWPVAGCKGCWVAPGTARKWEYEIGPFLDRTVAEGPLEYDLDRKTMDTMVYRGNGEPVGKRLTTAIKGHFATSNGVQNFPVSIRLTSDFNQVTAGYQYRYIVQSETPVFVQWEVSQDQFASINENTRLPTPAFQVHSNVIVFAGQSKVLPSLQTKALQLMTTERVKLFDGTVIVYAPK